MGEYKNKNVILFLNLILLAAGFFCFAQNTYAESKIIINELMWMGSSVSTADEWIELKNSTSDSINFKLTPWSLYKNDTLMILINTGMLEKNGYFLISNNSKDYSFSGGKSILNIDPDLINNDISLSNSSVQYKLYNGPTNASTLIDVADDKAGEPLAGENETVKKSMERNDESSDGTKKESWHTCFESANLDVGVLDCATPRAENSKKTTLPPIVYSDKIRINELLPKPDPKNNIYKEEFVELYNPSSDSEKLDDWFLKDRSGKNCSLAGKTIEAESFLIIKNNPAEKCTIALNDTQGETLELYNPEDAEPISKVSYDGSAKTGLSYSFDDSAWRWSKFLTPEAENIFNNLPEVKNEIPEKVYVNTYAEFSAKGSDKDNDNLEYTWDFGDGHKSYLQNTRHKYIETGKYTVTLKISDGSEDTIKTFKILVEKFPELDVKIVGLSPNPTGIDTSTEFLSILNNTKKKINLNGWSVASGTKTLSNHPITEDFFIKPKKVSKLTYAVSKFTLPNTKGKIELRYPNSKVASHVTYGDKKKTIAENATYEKTKHAWKWNEPAPKIAVIVSSTPPTAIPIVEIKPAAIIIEEKIPEEIAPDPELEKNLGKFSAVPEIKIKQHHKFSLINYSLGIKTAQAFSGENPPLPIPKKYFTLEESPAENDWLKNLSGIIFSKINSSFNWVLNKI